MSHLSQWLIVMALPFLIGGMVFGPAVLLLPLGGVLGVGVGLTSTGAHFTSTFKLELLTALLVCILLFTTGYRYRHGFWGKAMASLAIYGWCFVGLIGFGPQ